MPDPIPFPPRSAGAVLDAALKAAMDAASEALLQQQIQPWRKTRFGGHSSAHIQLEQVALMAALPPLRTITSSAEMTRVIAHGMAAEVMIRLRKIHGRMDLE
jgi:hypothetical protein